MWVVVLDETLHKTYEIGLHGKVKQNKKKRKSLHFGQPNYRLTLSSTDTD